MNVTGLWGFFLRAFIMELESFMSGWLERVPMQICPGPRNAHQKGSQGIEQLST